MSDQPAKFFVKFRMSEDRSVLTNFVFSFDEDELSDWPEESAKQKTEKVTEEKEVANFADILDLFQKSINNLTISTPFMMVFLPRQIDKIADNMIRSYAKMHGAQKTDGEYELYEVDVEHFHDFNMNFENIRSLRAGSGEIPTMFFMGMISAYDAFLSNLIRLMLLTKTEILSASERNITFKDLVEAGSIDIIRDRIMEKEIETVMRKSHSDQISYLEDKLGIPLTKDLEIWPDFIEIFERRNLLAHTAGAVSSQYLFNCKKAGYNTKEIRIGDVLSITSTYYNRSSDVILEFGIKLWQVVWRKLLPKEAEDAVSELNIVVFELLQRKQYKLAENIAKFGLTEIKRSGTDEVRKMLVVNHGLALKFQKKNEDMLKVLASEDWSASRLDFQICVAATKDDVDTVVKLLKPAIDTGSIDKNSVRTWPAFAGLKDDPKIIAEFQRVTGTTLYRKTEIPASTSSEDEGK
ncbi:hypothetical protein LPLAFNJD_LOCUS3860 [Methylorubrum aminovorans]